MFTKSQKTIKQIYKKEIIEWENKFGKVKYHPKYSKKYNIKNNKIDDYDEKK